MPGRRKRRKRTGKRRGSRRFFQRANASMERRGTKGSYGHKSMSEINADIRKGGAIAKKAGFAKAAKTVAKRRKRRSTHRSRKRTAHR